MQSQSINFLSDGGEYIRGSTSLAYGPPTPDDFTIQGILEHLITKLKNVFRIGLESQATELARKRAYKLLKTHRFLPVLISGLNRASMYGSRNASMVRYTVLHLTTTRGQH